MKKSKSDILFPEELKTMYEKKDFSPYSDQKIFADAKYNYQSLSSAPFFGEETLGIYLKIYEFLGNNGFSPALYELGLMYYNGEWWLPKDLPKSFGYHSRAAELGNTDAMFELYIYYSKGIAVTKNDALAFEWCKKAADKNHPRACYNMGTFYASGYSVAADMTKAVEWYNRASLAGNGQASATLGVMYKTGNGITADESKAQECFERAEMQHFDLKNFLAKFGVSRN